MRKDAMAKDPYVEWLVENLSQPGRSQSALARHLGLDPGAVNRIVKGLRGLKSHEITGAAEYFGVPSPVPGVDQGDRGNVISGVGLRPVRVAGRVAAGLFQEVDDFDQSEPEEIYVPADSRFPHARMLAFDVTGHSMNDLKPRPILEGDRIVGLAFEDVADQLKIRDGMVVVVERTRDGGHIREWSVKQVEFYQDRIEFHPRSTDAKFKPIVIQHDAHADDGTTVQIIAVVTTILNSIF
jgi:hypothetical protein